MTKKEEAAKPPIETNENNDGSKVPQSLFWASLSILFFVLTCTLVTFSDMLAAAGYPLVWRGGIFAVPGSICLIISGYASWPVLFALIDRIPTSTREALFK